MDSTDVTKYVLGFLFDPAMDRVVLIMKKRPEFLAGRLNGVGGKIEDGEDALEAMVREFHEEAGVKIFSWEPCGEILYPDAEISVYSASSNKINYVKTETDELITIVKTNRLFRLPLAPNIDWLVPMCKNVMRNTEKFWRIIRSKQL